MNFPRELIVMLGLFGIAVPMSHAGDAALAAWHEGDRQAAVAQWQARAVVGDAEAALYLGYLARHGIVLARDDAAAVRWYRRAAEAGHPEAQYELALMYELGAGVQADAAEAARWYELATGQHCPSDLRTAERLGRR